MSGINTSLTIASLQMAPGQVYEPSVSSILTNLLNQNNGSISADVIRRRIGELRNTKEAQILQVILDNINTLSNGTGSLQSNHQIIIDARNLDGNRPAVTWSYLRDTLRNQVALAEFPPPLQLVVQVNPPPSPTPVVPLGQPQITLNSEPNINLVLLNVSQGGPVTFEILTTLINNLQTNLPANDGTPESQQRRLAHSKQIELLTTFCSQLNEIREFLSHATREPGSASRPAVGLDRHDIELLIRSSNDRSINRNFLRSFGSIISGTNIYEDLSQFLGRNNGIATSAHVLGLANSLEQTDPEKAHLLRQFANNWTTLVPNGVLMNNILGELGGNTRTINLAFFTDRNLTVPVLTARPQTPIRPPRPLSNDETEGSNINDILRDLLERRGGTLTTQDIEAETERLRIIASTLFNEKEELGGKTLHVYNFLKRKVEERLRAEGRTLTDHELHQEIREYARQTLCSLEYFLAGDNVARIREFFQTTNPSLIMPQNCLFNTAGFEWLLQESDRRITGIYLGGNPIPVSVLTGENQTQAVTVALRSPQNMEQPANFWNGNENHGRSRDYEADIAVRTLMHPARFPLGYVPPSPMSPVNPMCAGMPPVSPIPPASLAAGASIADTCWIPEVVNGELREKNLATGQVRPVQQPPVFATPAGGTPPPSTSLNGSVGRLQNSWIFRNGRWFLNETRIGGAASYIFTDAAVTPWQRGLNFLRSFRLFKWIPGFASAVGRAADWVICGPFRLACGIISRTALGIGHILRPLTWIPRIGPRILALGQAICRFGNGTRLALGGLGRAAGRVFAPVGAVMTAADLIGDWREAARTGNYREAAINTGGAVIGGVIGACLGGPVGAITGAWLGRMAGQGANWLINNRHRLGEAFSNAGRAISNTIGTVADYGRRIVSNTVGTIASTARSILGRLKFW